MFNDSPGGGATVSLDIALFDHGNITLSLAAFDENKGDSTLQLLRAASVTLCTNGTWRVGTAAHGVGLNVTVGRTQRVRVTRDRGYISAVVGGRLIANESVAMDASKGNYTFRLMLSHYFPAAVDNFCLDHAR